MIKDKYTKLNVLLSLTQQAVVTISAFILPRILLQTFGSEINGLVSSINQFLSYVSLLEGGITGVVSASLYKPLVEKDSTKLSSVVRAADSFYKKVSYLFIIYTAVVAFLYPLVVNTGLSYGSVSSLVIILGVNLFVQYCFSITWKTLLIADGKFYLVSIVYISVVILNTVLTVIVIRLNPNIHIVKLVSAIVYFALPISYKSLVSHYYKIDYSVAKDNKLLSQRWDGFGINIAAFVHNNTDIVVLTLMATLSEVSVYSVYFLVVSGLKSIIVSVSQGYAPMIGQTYASGDKDNLRLKFGNYESTILFLTFFLFTVGGFAITPFVQIYTKSIVDADYYQPIFGWILVLSEMVFCVREPYVVLAYSANRFKQFKKIAYIETIINLFFSIILVHYLGLIGVAIGTLLAMLYRCLCQILYLRKHILYRTVFKLFFKIALNTLGFVVVLCIEHLFATPCSCSILSWIVYCVLLSFVSGIIFLITTIAGNEYFFKRILQFVRGDKTT